MLSGRHFLLLGILACAGLLSVHTGQREIELCYKLASIEKDERGARAGIELCKIQHEALQSPRAVALHAAELKLPVAQVSLIAPGLPAAPNLALAEPAPHAGTAQSHKPASGGKTGSRKPDAH